MRVVLGGPGGSLGWPVGDREAFAGGLSQRFQHGTLVIPATGTPFVAVDNP